MSVINTYKDPMTGKENHFAKGSIKFISIKPVKDGPNVVNGVKTTYIKVAGQPDKKIEATHSISFLLQSVNDDNSVVDANEKGEWINMGEKKLNPNYADKVQVKVGNDWKDILPGMVVSVPLKISQNGDKTYINASLAKLNILDESKAGAPAPRGNSAPAAGGSAQSGGSVKIYGEITALNGNTATVADEKLGSGDVVLSDAQLAEVQVGGRLTAFIVKETGVITGGFKAYGPAGQNSGSGSKGKGKYDPAGVSTGHAINVLANLKLAGFKGDLIDAGKVSHDVTTKLIKEFSDASGKDEGQSVGNAVKFAATTINVKGKTIDAAELEEATRQAYQTLSVPLREYIAPAPQESAQSAPQGASGPQKQASVPVDPPVDFDPPMDFDDDIPFAPVGLQYATHAIHAMYA